MRRFVVLRHETEPGTHHDLMLETEPGDEPEERALMTWRCDCGSPPAGGEDVIRLEDHRRHYLAFEGDIGGGRGTVTRVDSGDWELLAQGAERLRARLFGEHLKGLFELPVNGAGSLKEIEAA